MSSKYRRARKVPKSKDQSGRGGEEEILNHLVNGRTLMDQGAYNATQRFMMSAELAGLGLGIRGLMHVLSYGVPYWPKNYFLRHVASALPTLLMSTLVAHNTLSTEGMPYGAATVPGILMLAGMHAMIVRHPYMLTDLKNRLLGTQTMTPEQEEKEEKKRQLESAELVANAESARNSAQIRNDSRKF